jgi:predicted DNA-binding ribbon-helix-helix protein
MMAQGRQGDKPESTWLLPALQLLAMMMLMVSAFPLKRMMSMGKRTISATIEERFIEKLDEAAEARGISRSRLLQECIATWLEQETRERMKEGYLAQAETMRELAEEAWESQREILASESW